MADAIKVIWEEPPAPTREGKYSPFFNALRENPGRWARFEGSKGDGGAAAAIRSGKYAGTEKGEFEAVGRKDAEGKPGTWVRYVAKGAAKSSGASTTASGKRRGRPPGSKNASTLAAEAAASEGAAA